MIDGDSLLSSAAMVETAASRHRTSARMPSRFTLMPASRFMMDSIRSPNKLLVNVSTYKATADAKVPTTVDIGPGITPDCSADRCVVIAQKYAKTPLLTQWWYASCVVVHGHHQYDKQDRTLKNTQHRF